MNVKFLVLGIAAVSSIIFMGAKQRDFTITMKNPIGWAKPVPISRTASSWEEKAKGAEEVAATAESEASKTSVEATTVAAADNDADKSDEATVTQADRTISRHHRRHHRRHHHRRHHRRHHRWCR